MYAVIQKDSAWHCNISSKKHEKIFATADFVEVEHRNGNERSDFFTGR
jgi:hypothetical protein